MNNIIYYISCDGSYDGKSVCLWRKEENFSAKIARFQNDEAAKQFVKDFNYPLSDKVNKNMKKIITSFLFVVLILFSQQNCYGNNKFIEKDKQQHFIYGGVISTTTYIALEPYDKNHITSYIFPVIIGIGKEINDPVFDVKDVVATSLGGFCVTTLLKTIF